MAETKFATTGNVNDADKTPIDSYYIIGTSGYPVVFARAFKQTPNGAVEFTRGFYTIYSEKLNVEELMSLSFFEIADDINNFDNPETDYIIENFIYNPPDFLNIQSPTLTPEEKEKERADQALKAEANTSQVEQLAINADLIENALPDELKATGSAKLPSLLLKFGKQLLVLILPFLRDLVTKYSDEICPSESEMRNLISLRNNLVNQLNLLGTNINKIGQTLTGASAFLSSILTIIKTTDAAAIAISIAQKTPPLNTLPTPGTITSLLNDAQTFIRKKTFDTLGNSKLSKISGILNGSALVISLIGNYILQALSYIAIIDVFIEKCTKENPNLSGVKLVPVSDTIKELANAQRKAQDTLNQTPYKGFIIEIEEVPYNDKVSRRKAVGQNAQGITLIQTELSFTTNPQILINELKFIIDKDNLKAY